MRTRKTILAEYSQKHAELKGLLAKEALSAEEIASAKSLRDEVAGLDAELKALDEVEDMRKQSKAREEFLKGARGRA
jgi:hypothetical protein